MFTGWIGAGCTGTSPTCTVTITSTTSVSATFAVTGTVATLDIDLSAPGTTYDPATDGLLVLRYMFGLSDTALTAGATGATATRNDSQITSYLGDIKSYLDADGNGQVDALTDGLLIIRYLFGLTGSELISGAVGTGASRASAVDISNYLGTLKP